MPPAPAARGLPPLHPEAQTEAPVLAPTPAAPLRTAGGGARNPGPSSCLASLLSDQLFHRLHTLAQARFKIPAFHGASPPGEDHRSSAALPAFAPLLPGTRVVSARGHGRATPCCAGSASARASGPLSEDLEEGSASVGRVGATP